MAADHPRPAAATLVGGRALTVRGTHADGSGAVGVSKAPGLGARVGDRTPLGGPVGRRDAGGIVLGNRSLTAEDLVAFGLDIGDEAALEAEAAATE